MNFDDQVLEWVREALHASHADDRGEHEQAIKRLHAEYEQLQNRINAAYVDKLEGVVDAAAFGRMSSQWREQQNHCVREIERNQRADKRYMDQGVPLLELAQNAQKLFERREPREKRRLLNFLLSNCTWRDGEIEAKFRQPFDLLAETNAAAKDCGPDNKGNSAEFEIWRILEHVQELGIAA